MTLAPHTSAQESFEAFYRHNRCQGEEQYQETFGVRPQTKTEIREGTGCDTLTQLTDEGKTGARAVDPEHSPNTELGLILVTPGILVYMPPIITSVRTCGEHRSPAHQSVHAVGG